MATPDEEFYTIYSEDPNKFRKLPIADFKKSVNSAMKAIDAGIDPAYATLGPLISIIEGGKGYHGVIKNQDISRSRANQELAKGLQINQANKQRLSLKGVAPELAQQLILADKVEALRAKGIENPLPEDVATNYNTALPPGQYSGMLKETLKQIVTQPKNAKLLELLQPLFDRYQNSRSSKE